MSWDTTAAGHFGWGAVIEEGWRKGPWTAEEDKLLIEYVRLHGEGRWNSVSRLAGLKRNGKSCRLRWVNYLRPDLKRGQITPHEESIILELHARWGNRWSTIARSLPGRTDNEIKNYWRTHFKKKAKRSPDDSHKARTRLLKRQQLHQQQQLQQQQQQQQHLHQHQQQLQQEQQQYQQQLQQLNLLDMKKIMSLFDDNYENKAPYVPQMRQENTAPVFLNTADHEVHGSVYNLFNVDPCAPQEASNEEILWDGLWNLDDVHANYFGVASAPTKAGMQNLVMPFC